MGRERERTERRSKRRLQGSNELCRPRGRRSSSSDVLSLSLSLFISIPFAIKYLPQNVPAHVRLAFREVVGDRVDRHMIGHKINVILPLAPLLDLVESREINPE